MKDYQHGYAVVYRRVFESGRCEYSVHQFNVRAKDYRWLWRARLDVWARNKRVDRARVVRLEGPI